MTSESSPAIGVPLDVATSAPRVRPSAPVKLVLAVVLFAYLGQMTLQPAIAPLSRAFGFADWQLGLVVSLAACCIVATGTRWGRASQSRGRKPVLLLATALGAVALAGFAALAAAGVTGALSSEALFVGTLALRGLVFGIAIAAVVPTASAYIADVTQTEAERVSGMAGLGAVQGMAMIGGALIGGLSAYAGILGPVILAPVLLVAAFVLVATRLPVEPRHELIATPERVSPRDSRVAPFLTVEFLLFTALGMIQVTVGFIVSDRLALAPAEATVMTGWSLLAAGLGMLLAQGVVVPRLSWPPVTLIRAGACVALAGFAVLVPDLGLAGILASMVLVAAGIGLAMPGVSSGPSLAVGRAEQGSVAGLVAGTMAMTFIVAPALGTTVYGLWSPLPALLGMAFAFGAGVFAFTHPQLRAGVAAGRRGERGSAPGGVR